MQAAIRGFGSETDRFIRAAMLMLLILMTPGLSRGAPALSSGGVCTVSATPLAFGRYDPIGGRDLATVGMLHYRCFGNHGRLAIGLTTGTSNSFKTRRMGRGVQTIIYNLYLDAAGTQVWGDGTLGSQMYIVNVPASGMDMSIPIYGRLFGHQNASAGSYQDSVSVVVSY
jgi:spore coat protein U-like protein